MTKTILVALLALTVGAVAHAGYELVFVPRVGRDVTVFDPGPCILPERTLSVAPLQHGDAVLLFYTCQNPYSELVTVRVREYGMDAITPPQFIAPPPPVSCSHIPGFVPSKDGLGCVPPGHPNAR